MAVLTAYAAMSDLLLAYQLELLNEAGQGVMFRKLVPGISDRALAILRVRSLAEEEVQICEDQEFADSGYRINRLHQAELDRQI